MRRRSLVAALLVAAAVALAFSWFGWGREGLTPVEPAATGAEGIDDLYKFIGAFAVLIFLSVMIPLALILARYRARGLPRETEGPQVRGNTRLEIGWTVVPFLMVLVISAFTLYKAGGIEDPAPAAGQREAFQIRVEGRQFYWRYVYPNGAIAVDRLRLPVHRRTDLLVTAPGHDVIHSFWVPALGGKVDAIPGTTNELSLRPTKVGEYDGKCAELCGIQHAAMNFTAEVLPGEAFDAWLRDTAAEQQRDETTLGEELFTAVCTKCHFAAPEYAPSLAGNPLLGDANAVRQIVTDGRGRMPAVGRGWTERELDALARYARTFSGQGGEDGE